MYLVAAASLAAVVSAASAAHATLVDFGGPITFPDTSQYRTVFACGTFSHDLSGTWAPDGFRPVDQYSAFNWYGQNGEYISFNAPVTLNSLKLGPCSLCLDTHPASFTVNLYNAASVLLASQSITGSSTEETLNFDTSNVSKVEFTFAGVKGANPYGDGREVAWYLVRDISYTLGGGAVPEPAVWALMIGGFGMAGVALRRRKAAKA